MRNNAAVVVVLAIGCLVGTPCPALGADCALAKPPQRLDQQEPWAQQALGINQVTPFADGHGITVAVLDSGVDSTHPQLNGHVLAGANYLRGGSASTDCRGHGTAVASLIAAQPAPDSPLRGLAPGVTILPVTVSERELIDGAATGATATPAQLAAAIDWAVDHRADVLNLSLAVTQDSRTVRRAIQRAVRRDVVVVAAAGNGHDDGNPTPYPAAYPGVLGVGAVGASGLRESYSPTGPYVDVVAPGGQVTTAWPGGYAVDSGTSYAAPYVAATAALVRQRWPRLTAAQVVARIVGTADPAAGDPNGYGAGLLNPYRAVTEPTVGGAPMVPSVPVVAPVAHSATAGHRAATARTALRAATVGGLVLLAGLLAALVLPRGHRRRWRHGN